MAKKKSTNKPKQERAEDAKNQIIKEFINSYETIENAEKEAREKLAPIFRKTATEMYLAVKVNKIWKSGRALAKSMNKNNVVIQRYINAGEWLANKTDEELAKHGLTAYDAKTQLRKMKALDTKKASINKVKNATAKKNNKVATCNHGTIDGVVTLLKTIVEHEKDKTKLYALRSELNAVIARINSKANATPKGQALTKVLVK